MINDKWGLVGKNAFPVKGHVQRPTLGKVVGIEGDLEWKTFVAKK